MPVTPDPATLLTPPAEWWNQGSGSPTVVTYSFAEDGTTAFGDVLPAANWASFNAAQQASARLALASFAAVSGLSFVEVPDTPVGAGIDLRFRLEELGSYAIAGTALAPPLGDIALNLDLFRQDSLAPSPTRIGFSTLLHEIGHAIGEKHPFEGTPTLDPAIDTTDVTVMAYTPGKLSQPQGPRPLDVQAIDTMYGAAAQKAAEGATWSWDASARMLRADGIAGNDTLRGDDQPALLHGGGGDDRIIGGTGHATLLLDAPLAAAQLDLGAGLVRTAAGNDSFTGIAALQFADGTLTLAADDPAAEVLRLYRVALGRTPDAPGLADWVGKLAAGMGLHDVAAGFLGSQEFLHRSAAAGGAVVGLFAADLGTSGGGNSGCDPAATLLDWADSAAARQATAADLAAGIWVTDPGAAEIARLYETALHRAPDRAGFADWMATRAGGASAEQIAAGFLYSPEFTRAHGLPDRTGLAALLLPGITADPIEAAALAASLPTGGSDAAWLLALADSTAAQLHFGAATDGGVVFA